MSTVDELLKIFTDQFNLAFLQLDERKQEIEEIQEIQKSIQERNEKIDAKIQILAKNLKEIKLKIENPEKNNEDNSLQKLEAKILEINEQFQSKNLEKTAEFTNSLDQRIKKIEDQGNNFTQNILDFKNLFEQRNQEINAKIENLSMKTEELSHNQENINSAISQKMKEIQESKGQNHEMSPGLKEEEIKKLIEKYDNGIQISLTQLSHSMKEYQDAQNNFEKNLSEVKTQFINQDDFSKINKALEEEIKGLRTDLENSLKNLSGFDEKVATIINKEIEKNNANASNSLKELESRFESYLTKDHIDNLHSSYSEFEKSLKNLEEGQAKMNSQFENYTKSSTFNSKMEQLKAFLVSKIETLVDQESSKNNDNQKSLLSKFEGLENNLKSSLENTSNSIKSTEASLKNEFDQGNKKIDDKYGSLIDGLNKQILELIDKVKGIEEGHSESKETKNYIDTLADEIKELKQESSKIQNSLSKELASAISSLTAKLKEIEEQEQKSKNDLKKEIDASIGNLSTKLDSIENQVSDSVKNSSDNILKKIKELEEHENQTKSSMKNDFMSSLNDFSAKLNSIEQKEKESKDSLLKELSSNVSNINSKLSAIEANEKESKAHMFKELNNSIEGLSNKLSLLETKEKESKDSLLAELNSKISNINSKMSSMEDSEKESKAHVLQELNNSIEGLSKKLNSLEANEKESHDSLLAELNTNISSLNSKLSSLELSAKESKDHILKELNNSVEDLSNKLTLLEEKEKEAKGSFIVDLKSSLHDITTRINSFETQENKAKQILTTDLKNLESKLEEAEKKLKAEFENKLYSSISSTETKLTNSLTETSKKTDAAMSELNITIELVKQNIKKNLSDNQTSLTFQSDQFKLNIHSMEEKLMQALSNLKKEVDTEFKNQTSKQSEIQQLLENQLEQKVKEIHSNIESLNQTLKKHNEHVSQTDSTLETRIEEVATRMEMIKQDVDDRIDKEIEIINSDNTTNKKLLDSQQTNFDKLHSDFTEFQAKILQNLSDHNNSLTSLAEARDSIISRVEFLEPKVLNFKENDDSRYAQFIENFQQEKITLQTRFEELQKKAENLTNVVEEALVSDVTSFKKSIQLLTESNQALIKDLNDIREIEIVELKNDLLADIENISKKMNEYNTQNDTRHTSTDEKLNLVKATLQESIENLSSSTKESFDNLIAENKTTHETLEKTISERFLHVQNLIDNHSNAFSNFKLENTAHIKDMETNLTTHMTAIHTKLEESVHKTNERFKERCNLQESKLNELRGEVEAQNCIDDVKKLNELVEEVKTKHDEEFLGVKKKLISQDSSTKELEDYWNITYLNLKERVQVIGDNVDAIKKKIPDAELVSRIPKIEEGMVRTNKAIANVEEHHRIDFAAMKEKHQTALSELDSKLSDRIIKLNTFAEDLSNKCTETFEKIISEGQGLSQVVKDHYENRVTSEFVSESIEKESIRLLELIQKTDGFIVNVEKKIGEQTNQYKTDMECLSKTVESAKKAYDNYNNKVSELAESDRKIQKEIQRMINFNDIQHEEIELDVGAQITQDLTTENDSGHSSNFEYKTDFDELVSHVQSSLKNQQEGFAKGIQSEVDSLSKMLRENQKILSQRTNELDSENKKILSRQKNDGEALQNVNIKLAELQEALNHLNHLLTDSLKSVWDTIGIMSDRITKLEFKRA